MRAGRILTAAALLVVSVLGLPAPAGAQITGGCSATIAGSDAGAAQSVRTAIPVDEKQTVVVQGNAPGPITGYNIYLVFAGIKIPAGSGTVDNGKTSYQTTVNVADYSKYGAGIYRVQGETIGTPCEGWAYVKVTGRFPLTTLAGIVATLLTALGLLGLILSRPRKPKLAPGQPAPVMYQAPMPGAGPMPGGTI